jgi:uncharacterized protein (TIGR02265 family)
MAEERFIFPAAVEGMLKGMGKRATPAFKAHLKSHGLDFDNVPPAIPMATWTPFLRAAATFTWPEVPEDEAMRLLGLHFIRGWQNTAMGSAMSVMLRLLGPVRTLTRLDRAFRTSDNFTRAVTEMVGENEALITINEVQGAPTYWIGILQGGLEVLGREGSVTLHEAKLPSATLRVTWVL